MARFNLDTAEKYGGNGGGTGFFSLKDDGDIAVVRFLYDTPDDVEGYAVHEVEIDGKKRYVNCLREYNQPIDDCPFCKAKMKVIAKLFVPVYNEDEGKSQVWERGKKFFSTLSGTLVRYNDESIVSQTFEIERHGKKGDTSTTYNIFRTRDKADDSRLEDFDMPQILGGVVLDKSAEEMVDYLETGYFTPADEEPQRRRSSNRDEEERPRRRTQRRTPSDTF